MITSQSSSIIQHSNPGLALGLAGGLGLVEERDVGVLLGEGVVVDLLRVGQLQLGLII